MKMPALPAACLLAVATTSSALAAPAVYDAPQDALSALISAVEDRDRAAILAVFGEEAEDLFSEDGKELRRQRRQFLEMYAEGYRFVPQEDGGVVLELGTDGWPFPIPLAQRDAGWSFDVEAGRVEMAAREIGMNEIEVMTLLDAYLDLQIQYRLTDHDGDGVMEFAQSVVSSEGQRDGLYWPGDDSPIGEAGARASLDGFNDGTEDVPPEPYKGYYFRILTGQTQNAPGGEMSYVVNGNMIGGHAVLAIPADYGASGVHSFMASENGTILEADLGEETLDKGFAITLYDPGEGWTPTELEE
ncbi:DUF2950 domain-containing protein [Defluviimonas salinarum]|uniref:DUF2950 domain-containing protein n=1 Tax=Defluviimonas salinarum TaxID=2992147 RepID=A0ABT3J132_9RHOB|nr:DUF2950 domain-containing protein [Defluviimonas salinarum]MCW3781396.1 DUF2950 domain-containing protein [Defluviimonas salinarum]